MQYKKAVKGFLKTKFLNTKETKEGFKINQQQLTNNDLDNLNHLRASANVKITIKRSGTGLVVIIE